MTIASGLSAPETPAPSPGKAKPARDPRDTPAMRQHARFKAQHPDCILLFRMGDFYELFFEDAKLASRVLGLTLTERTSGIPMAGVPYHAVENYIRRLIEQGYRVAVCDQIQDPKEAKGVVDRAVTRVLTPGTLVDESLLDEASDNQLAAIQFLESGDHSAAVLAIAELSTGRFTLLDLDADQVIDEMARRRPSELLYVETADGNVPPRVKAIEQAIACSLTPRSSWTFRQSDATGILRDHFQVTTLTGFGFDEHDSALGPAGALVRYLQDTQSPDADSGDKVINRLGHLQPPARENTGDYLAIDAASLASLEIERTIRSGSYDGSLLSVLQHCCTPMGKRLLRRWLCFPLRDIRKIEARQDAVAVAREDGQLADQLHQQIAGVQDVARIAGRIAMFRATPRDLVALGKSVSHIGLVAQLIDAIPAFATQRDRLEAIVNSLQGLSDTITRQCCETPPSHLRDGGLFLDGVDGELDETRLLQRDANTWLAAYQKRLIEQTDINSLKVGYNKVFGYYIEITHTHTAKVPLAFSRKQTLKNAERYITTELKEFEDKVLTAQSRAIEREKQLFERLCRQAAALVTQLGAYADIIAELDVILCFADIARRYGYVRPQLVDEPILDIKQGRHPVLDRTLGEKFVPNDCKMLERHPAPAGLRQDTEALGQRGEEKSRDSEETRTFDQSVSGPACPKTQDPGPKTSSSSLPASRPSSLSLITGPNMAGKSTYIRQVALIVLLAHTGCSVPADSATIGLTDRIFTRIGASDELHAGQSTFMVEMTETANILHHATERSLVILDEIGRGTSTLDGLSLAWAIAESLAAIGCRTLFATHYHELTSLSDRLPNVANLHVSVREWGDEIIFIFRIMPGCTDRSYGIHVARIAGLPGATIRRAHELLESLVVQTETTHVPESKTITPPPSGQLSLFTEYVDHPVVEVLRKADLNAMSPLEAFDLLRTLRNDVESPNLENSDF